MSAIPIPAVPGNGPGIRSAVLRDFTGGLNFRDDSLQLAANEVTDILDLDLSAQGGVNRRLSFQALGVSGLDSTVEHKFLFEVADDTSGGKLFVGSQSAGSDYAAWYTTFTGNHAVATTAGFTNPSTLGQSWSGALMKKVSANGNQNLYIHRDYLSKVQAWLSTGVLSSELTDSYGNYNENFAAPTGGTMPLASLLCAHHEYMFHADTYENSIRHDSRIRWSHPGNPGDYRLNDFIDVGEGQDNDRITAMVSAFGALFVFKARSVWMVDGYDTDTFSVKRIALGVGTSSKFGACASQYGVAFFDQNLGAHEITYQRGPAGRMWSANCLWNKLNAAIKDGRLTDSAHACMTWVGSRLYVSGMKWNGAAHANRTFMMDMQVGPGWTAYGVGFKQMCEYQPYNAPPQLAGLGPWDGSASGATHYDRVAIQGLTAGALQDRWTSSTDVPFAGYMQTSWVTGGDPSLKKRFRRFSIVFDNLPAANQISVSAFKNWNNILTQRSFTITGDYAGGDPIQQKNVRGGTIGTAYAVSLYVTGPDTKQWGFNMLTLRFVPQRIV